MRDLHLEHVVSQHNFLILEKLQSTTSDLSSLNICFLEFRKIGSNTFVCHPRRSILVTFGGKSMVMTRSLQLQHRTSECWSRVQPHLLLFWFQQVCNFPVGLTCHYYPKTYIKQSTQLLFAIGGCSIITPHSPTLPPSSPSPPLPRHLPTTKIGWWLTWEPSVAFCGRKGTGEILFPCSEKALTD